ncbi:PREDICTED: VPS10 domain-containing receptor SorCS3-like [Apaloderma vittatum]|uniref:VPS10 domain-containing receptor SorCS3-like n=1 Tax=Apaloderma vittatum TaxID=57397 RepID=UPI0005213356|nr:PREDICTED: VPS10 domain-containing receptor SorCS3-like [Apaloderma vittatum]
MTTPLVDLTPSHSGSAMLMLLSVVFVGLAVFIIYKFKRKIPGINIYAQMQNEKDQEMVSPVSQRESIPNVPQSELMSPEQLVDEKLEVQPIEQLQATVQNPRKGNATKVVWTEDFQKACGSPRGFKPKPGAEVFPQLLSPRAQKKSLPM